MRGFVNHERGPRTWICHTYREGVMVVPFAVHMVWGDAEQSDKTVLEEDARRAEPTPTSV
ncbi:hypothetical protein DICSQDRAFT_141418 [Dichomitus squalens LYAD-421 SS1]|uniref:Uncharacterized protein n=1 Tax=Dichomitus squalens (strain LYAD-421) TaxID=732165 RepID=R7SJ80_DICSQ|nr:uncharacterized protein DICSQDRAFT_141418 [Dichomitus squalens LYAD-421 SS1]EJF56201.1 hypothetical protein DICSQDRAFT_141418 [Dichomitus squalens LYAD-421 SS1]